MGWPEAAGMLSAAARPTQTSATHTGGPCLARRRGATIGPCLLVLPPWLLAPAQEELWPAPLLWHWSRVAQPGKGDGGELYNLLAGRNPDTRCSPIPHRASSIVRQPGG
mmetsp:Transcript_24060/g.66838  ORF Transcript_24060/g.66838 Transcript_24060/m.66838 type:complete len:109 (+) Transcript_24060:478-804(+)